MIRSDDCTHPVATRAAIRGTRTQRTLISVDRITAASPGPLLSVLLLGSAAQAAPFAYITNSQSNSVSVINTASNTVIATVAVATGPVALGSFVGPDAEVLDRIFRDGFEAP